MSRLVHCAILAIALLLSQAVASEPVGSQQRFSIVRYVAPVDAPVIDPFRPPAHIGAPGNRGLEYGNPLFVGVFAAADGVASFAGMVAGRGVVSIEHSDGVRTTYTGMTTVWAETGRAVRQGEAVGLAGRNIHFGARIRDHYLDPQVLIDESEGSARPRLISTTGG